MRTKQEVAIHALNSIFGVGIGMPKPSDTVIGVKDGVVTLCSDRRGEHLWTKTFIMLDVNIPRIVGEKTMFYDEHGVLQRTYEHPPPY